LFKNNPSSKESFNFERWCEEIDKEPAFSKDDLSNTKTNSSIAFEALKALTHPNFSSNAEINLFEKLRKGNLKLNPAINNVDEIEKLKVCIGGQEAMVYVDEITKSLIWPLLIQFPEFSQLNLITDCSEDSLLEDILQEVFTCSEDVYFKKENLRFFVEIYGLDEHIMEVKLDESLRYILSHENVVINNGLPVIQIYTKNYIVGRIKKEKSNIYIFW